MRQTVRSTKKNTNVLKMMRVNDRSQYSMFQYTKRPIHLVGSYSWV